MAYVASDFNANRAHLRTPNIDDDIVISGVSGKYPNSKNVAEFSYNLYNKIDMVDDKETRWKHVDATIPKRMGKIDGLEKFDSTFFGTHLKQSKTMDPQSRILIETAFEAIIDAGINPNTLRGSKTGVFVGACFSESDKVVLYEKINEDGMGITGGSRAMFANRISYSLGLQGPSFLVDTACSSSMYALDCAFGAMRSGQCDAAIVGGSNIMLHPNVTREFASLGVLASDGYCRPFSCDATGYTRAEAISCIFLQKAKNAKRIYATILYSKTNCDGYKQEGITFPSRAVQENLLREFYNDVKIHPNEISFVEAHSTGTQVGDPEECHAIDNVLCTTRNRPLLVGSVKSNMGHSESSSGVCSITKVILALESGVVPPNINFKEIRQIPSLVEGRLKVCTEPTKLDGLLVGINSFGFGGANAHALLYGNEKEKTNDSIPNDDIPRLVPWSGRTEDGIDAILNDIETRPLDKEHIALLHSIQSTSISGYNYRGFGLFQQDGNENAKCIVKESEYFAGIKRPVVWMFSGMGSQWTQMGAELMHISMFRQSIQKSHDILLPLGLDLKTIITSTDPAVLQNILNIFVGIAAIQVAIVDILRELNLTQDFIIGHSVGELGCAYADGCFTAKQMILAAYARGLVSQKTKCIRGSMAAVGLGYNDLKDKLVPGIEIACHNSSNSSTISGPEKLMNEFIEDFQRKGIFAKAVPCSNIAYHSKYIAEMGPQLLEELRKIIPTPRKRSVKWLSSSVPKSEWNMPKNQLSSAEYHTNNLLNAVLFEEAVNLLPKDAIVIEIAPHGLLQAIVKKSMPDAVHIPLTHRASHSNLSYFLNGIGKLYVKGIDIPISRIYPTVQFPVSRGTAMISPLIKWDHSVDHFIAKYGVKKGADCGGEKSLTVDLKDSEYKYIEGHCIDGRCIVPATAYLRFVWETLNTFMTSSINMMNVEFEDVRFIRATALTAGQPVELTVIIQIGTGQFEITERGSLVVTGIIRHIDQPEPILELPPQPKGKCPIMKDRDFYKELRLRGYHYDGEFRSVIEARGDGLGGKVKWNNKWVPFLDCLLQINIVGKDTRNIVLPTRIQKIRINEIEHMRQAAEFKSNQAEFEVKVCPELGILTAGGVEITEIQTNTVGRRKPPGSPILETYQFIPLFPTSKMSISDAIRVFVQIALENDININARVVEIINKTDNNITAIIENFAKAMIDLPLVVPDLILLTQRHDIQIEGVSIVTEDDLLLQKDCLFVVATNLMSKPKLFDSSKLCLRPNGYLISRENCNYTFNSADLPPNFELISMIGTKDETLILLQYHKTIKKLSESEVILLSSTDDKYQWLPRLNDAIKQSDSVIVVAQNEPNSGILGLINCIRREPRGTNVCCVMIDDNSAPLFDLRLEFYHQQLKAQLAFNVYRNGNWGTYRHLPLIQAVEPKPRKDHCYANVLVKGDLSTFKWLEGPLASSRSPSAINVHFNALNFRDVMLATGRISMESFDIGRLKQEMTLGFEFSGVNKNGNRVMGTAMSGCMGTLVIPDNLTWEIPETWSLHEAATVPVVYATVYLAFFIRSKISSGKSILIHAGSGGVGLAAIRVALAYGMEVFTTVSTPEKKKYIMDQYPKLKESNIGNSRDCTFESMIKLRTKGKGVDFVLNSLAEEKLQASIRCLAKGGTFLEIGKFDLANDTKIGLGHFLKDITICSVMADRVFAGDKESVVELYELIDKDLKSGIIQPLHSTIFEVDDIEKAYRYLSTGKHIGKVLIKMRNGPYSKESVPIRALPRVRCDENFVYILPGGLGGFGLELADWLVVRGARKLILSSSRGITNTYQEFKIQCWENYGCKVLVNTSDITTNRGCEKLIHAALGLGPIGGIFNLAVALRDAILENQTEQQFSESIGPKALATKYLDELTRKMCPHLKYFVVFSSVSCGRGNAGQSNYGMANSIMERIVEQRVADGLPGKAIQWGAIGEVGLVAEMAENKLDLEIGGTVQQRISSCLTEFDCLATTPEPVVSCMVVAEKRCSSKVKTTAIERLLNIFGIRDIKSVSMNTSLSEMGMDSLMLVEIKQTLEREFELFLSTQELRALTLSKLKEFTDTVDTSTGSNASIDGNRKKSISNRINLLLDSTIHNVVDYNEPIIRLKSMNSEHDYKSCVLIVPGIEGIANDAWRNVSESIELPVYFLQFASSYDKSTMNDITNAYYNHVVSGVFKKTEQFYIVAHSYGSILGIELARLLERCGKVGKLIIIDGGPAILRHMFNRIITDKNVLDNVLIQLALNIFPVDVVKNEFKNDLDHCTTNEQKINKFLQKSGHLMPSMDEKRIRQMIEGIANRIKSIENLEYFSLLPKIESKIILLRPLIGRVQSLAEDYDLSNCTNGTITVDFIDGNHNTMLYNSSLISLINKNSPGSLL